VTTGSNTTGIAPIWLDATVFLSVSDVSGTLTRDASDRVVLCLECAYGLQEFVFVAEPQPAPADSRCASCGRYAWGKYKSFTAGPGRAGPALLGPADLAELRLSYARTPDHMTTSDLAQALGDLHSAAAKDLVDLLASPASGRDHLRLLMARRAFQALWAARGLVQRIDRALADPAPDLLLRLRGMVEAVRAGYGPHGNGEGPYASELAELNALLDPAAESQRAA
jgi:hypothetical protein